MNAKKNTLDFVDLLIGMISILPRIPRISEAIEKMGEMTEDSPISIGSILEKNARRYRDRPAIYFEDQEFSHFEFNAQANRYANYFSSRNITKGTVVVVFLENRIETVFIIAALAKLGAVASLINSNQKGKVLQHSIETDQGDYFIIGEERVDSFEAIREHLSLLENTLIWGLKNDGSSKLPEDYEPLAEQLVHASTDNPAVTKTITLGDRFANVFTSGTTGLPKASIQNHRKWYICYLWYGIVNLDMNPNDVLYIPIPFFHTNALIVAWPSAASGGSAMAIRRKLSISNFWKDVIKYNVSSFIYIGEICRYLMNKPPTTTDKAHRVRKIVGNGLRPDIWKAFKKRFNIERVSELYGASDGNVSFTNVFNLDCTVGHCRADYAIVKYDVETDRPIRNGAGFMEKVRVGNAGLLLGQITEATPFAGYVNKSKNKEKIFENVFEKGDRWFYTGDLIRDIGYNHGQFVDRLGDTFRWKGENVSTAEIEAIINNMPDVAHSAVYGVNLPHIDGKAGMACLMPLGTIADFDFKGFTATLRSQLASYAVPLFVRFVPDFEKTATHKIRKGALKKEGILLDGDCDLIFVLLPGQSTYQKINPELKSKIKSGTIQF